MRSLWLIVSIVIDIASMKVFVWVLAQLFPWSSDAHGGVLDSHLFFYDRYSCLAAYHRLKGRTATADRLDAIAEAFYDLAPDDDEPPRKAAGMAMPVPRPPLNTNAVSTIRIRETRAGRSSDLVPAPS